MRKRDEFFIAGVEIGTCGFEIYAFLYPTMNFEIHG